MCESTCPSRGPHSSRGSSGNRTKISERLYPEYADPAAEAQVEELESLGILSRTEMSQDMGVNEDDPNYANGYLLDLRNSRVFSTVSLDQYQQESLGVVDESLINNAMQSYDSSGYAQFLPDNCACGSPHDSLGIMDEGMMDANMFGVEQTNIQDTSQPSAMDEVSQALESPSQMTVFDPEMLNSTMAPRTPDLNVRRQVLLNSFIKDLDSLEQTEEYEIDALLQDFHRRRREDLNMS